ncbi:PQQ-dependent sugar dehydrogenase [Luteolibacter flavescens]|uniref:PQQ-dependent sugar dehydrogenase n=1 Tax=Luteolibacter flavescens TaxID=1859460 RepID=A0ABT3FIT0_9BACT|nr:PQQ-dependent sugar dehydrogenase [Luteolibacter flavescens]MCW1883463.1 PQQ-dependent sugar dehydrogenase [Luteolibacter flavescens]
MRLTLIAATAITVTTLAFVTLSPAEAKPRVETVATGFERPLWVGAPSHVKDRLWVIEQVGRIWVIDAKTGEKQKEPFLDISSQVRRKGNEEGLLGLAFAADFQKSGRFYLNFTDRDQNTRIVRMTSKGPDFNTADPNSMEILMSYKQDFENHNGGWIGFGPDGMLYIGNGDGGSANDPKQRAQAMDTYLGKMLRIDVSPDEGYTVPKDNPFVGKDGVKPEIWALGLRNPWRCSFDRETGDFWIADVGQNKWEEINFLAKGKGAGGNFGWRLREGDQETPQNGVGGRAPKGAIEPVYVYEHGAGPKDGLSVTGGYVYRGPIKELQGRYFFGDYNNRRVWSYVPKNGRPTKFEDHTDDFQPEKGKLGLISSFGEDSEGNLYIVDHGGAILRVVDK